MNDSDYYPLCVNLEPHFETRFADLPEELKPLITACFSELKWDDLSADQRRSHADQLQHQNDPRLEPVLYFELATFQKELATKIGNLKDNAGDDAVYRALRDVYDRINEILNADRAQIGLKIRELIAGQKSDYTTELLKIQNQAIQKFCIAGAYPKKDSGEVVNWITEQKADRTTVSRTIADTMETIIAPRPYVHHRTKSKKLGG